MARCHVAEFEVRVERQESLLAALTNADEAESAEEAHGVLMHYRETLAVLRARLNRLRAAMVRG